MLIFLRRFIAVLFFPIFLLLFIATLLIWRVQDTFGDPQYIKDELVKADIYNFAYDDVAVPLVAEALDTPEDFLNDDLAELEIRPDEDAVQLVGFVRDFLPPEELQVRVEHVVDQFIPYITGETDQFEIQLRIGERVTAWPELLPARLDALDAGNRLSDAALAPILFNAFEALETGGLDVSITRQRSREIVSEVAPGDWIETQVVNATRQISGWLTRDEEGFEIKVRFGSRIDEATQALKEVLDAADAETFLFEQVVLPELTGALGPVTQLSNQIDISDREVTQAIRAVAPPEWIREQRNLLIDDLSGYLSGERPRLALSVDLSERASTAATVLVDLAEQKLVETVNAIPTCRTVAEGVTAGRDLQGGQLPSCKPPGISGNVVVNALVRPLEGEIEDRIVALIPKEISFTNDDLEELIGTGIVSDIERVRGWVADGFVYSDVDIQRELTERDSDFDLDDLDVVRDTLDDDFTLTEVDFTDRILADDADAKSQFDDIRDYVGTGRDLWWLSLILPALIVVLIGFLGGRNWTSRVKWAMLPVFISALAIWIAASPVYDRYAQDEIDQGIADITEEIEREETRVVVVEAINRGVDVLVRWKDGYGGLARSFAIGSGIVLVLAFIISLYPNSPTTGGPARGTSSSGLDPESQAAYESLKADEETTRLGDAPTAPSGGA